MGKKDSKGGEDRKDKNKHWAHLIFATAFFFGPTNICIQAVYQKNTKYITTAASSLESFLILQKKKLNSQKNLGENNCILLALD